MARDSEGGRRGYPGVSPLAAVAGEQFDIRSGSLEVDQRPVSTEHGSFQDTYWMKIHSGGSIEPSGQLGCAV